MHSSRLGFSIFSLCVSNNLYLPCCWSYPLPWAMSNKCICILFLQRPQFQVTILLPQLTIPLNTYFRALCDKWPFVISDHQWMFPTSLLYCPSYLGFHYNHCFAYIRNLTIWWFFLSCYASCRIAFKVEDELMWCTVPSDKKLKCR